MDTELPHNTLIIMVSTLRHKSLAPRQDIWTLCMLLCVHDITCGNHHISDGEWLVNNKFKLY